MNKDIIEPLGRNLSRYISLKKVLQYYNLNSLHWVASHAISQGLDRQPPLGVACPERARES
jgi:hypothetical protein